MQLIINKETSSKPKMADLDNFFAKKDKRKKTGKGFSKANTEVIAKNLEEVEKKELAAQEKEITLLENTDEEKNILKKKQLYSTEDDDWNEYREKVKDYSVLQIEAVRLVSTDNEQEPVSESNDAAQNTADATKDDSIADDTTIIEDPFEDDTSEKKDEEMGSIENIKRDTPSPNPINGVITDNQSINTQDINGGINGSNDPKTGSKPSSYVPPHLRISQPPQELNVTPTGAKKSRRSKKVAPDINSEVYFPCLGVGVYEGGISREPSPVPSISPVSPNAAPLKGAWGKKLEM